MPVGLLNLVMSFYPLILDSRLRRNDIMGLDSPVKPGNDNVVWIPAFAGMT
jgi:hypothetical protein